MKADSGLSIEALIAFAWQRDLRLPFHVAGLRDLGLDKRDFTMDCPLTIRIRHQSFGCWRALIELSLIEVQGRGIRFCPGTSRISTQLHRESGCYDPMSSGSSRKCPSTFAETLMDRIR